MPAYKQSTAASTWTAHNKVQLIRGGSDYFDLLLKLIGEAKESIHLQTYIYDDDVTGRQVAEALAAAVKRKVEVYVLADGYASKALSKSFIHQVQEAGIHFRYFEPLFRSRHFYFGRRLHHKLVVTDTRFALVGGINISDRYNDMPQKPAWLDFAIYAEGDISRELCILCWKTWNGYPAKMGLTPCEKISQPRITHKGKSSLVRMRRNDWVRRKNQISKTYIEMLMTSRSQVTILCSYFLPGHVIRKNIAKAVNRGVKVKVVMAGLSDVKVAKNAERYMYDWMLRNKVDIYEYQKNILHGKIAICDSEWMTIGSYNVNNISAYASIELNLDVKNAVFAKQAEDIIEQIIATDCIRITGEQLAYTKNIFKQFIRWCSYKFISAVFYMFTFYFKQRKYL